MGALVAVVFFRAQKSPQEVVCFHGTWFCLFFYAAVFGLNMLCFEELVSPAVFTDILE